MYFWGLNPRRAGFLKFGYWPGKALLGAGKILSKKMLDACDWSPWPDQKSYGGMDGAMMKRLGPGNLKKQLMTVKRELGAVFAAGLASGLRQERIQ